MYLGYIKVQFGSGSYGCMLNWDPSQDVLGIKVQSGSGSYGCMLELGPIPGCTLDKDTVWKWELWVYVGTGIHPMG